MVGDVGAKWYRMWRISGRLFRVVAKWQGWAQLPLICFQFLNSYIEHVFLLFCKKCSFCSFFRMIEYKNCRKSIQVVKHDISLYRNKTFSLQNVLKL